MDKYAIIKSLTEQLSLDEHSKVLVVGLGKTGFSAAKFLHEHNIPFAVVDTRKKPPYIETLFEHYPDTPVFTGGFESSTSAFSVATHLLVSPGISLKEPQIQKALMAGVKLMSDIDLFALSTSADIVAITGSNGKSTVTKMLGDMGNEAGKKTVIGGNLGTPALDLLDKSIELYVLELSSFQLERTSFLNATVATVLNVTADHQDRHLDMKEYAEIKQSVFSGTGIMVINGDDPVVAEMKNKDRRSIVFRIEAKNGFHLGTIDNEEWLMKAKKPLLRTKDLPLEGLHNVANALAALALGTAVGLNDKAMSKALIRFKGLNHRMQKVAKVNGVTWVNDSKATNIGACIAALKGYKKKVVLIAGGDAKGADMNDLIPAINEKAKCIVLMGKDAGIIERAINGIIPSNRAKSVQEAVQIAAKLAIQGENVLLSPACASIDQYKSYKERGDKFTAAVMDLAV